MLSRVATWGSLLRQAAEAGLKLLTRSTQQRERSDGRAAPSRSRTSRTGESRSGESRSGESRSDTSRTGTSRTEARPRPSTGGARTAPARDRARRVAYAPDLDGAADPGEVVWTWVPYEEDDGRGKDRPVLVVGREGRDLVGLMLSSQADRADDRNWVGVGAGKWDGQGRPSYVRLDRVIEVGEHEIRREGAVLDKRRFDRVAQELRERYGWT
jgi:PemK-like, MazF-like toxin of type II toxin-antitoxin system